MTKRAITTAAGAALVGVACLAMSAPAAAKPLGPVAALAAEDCAREKVSAGKRAFRKRFGPKRPMAACIRSKRAEAARAIALASAACQEELAESAEDFFTDWDSFADCVGTYADWEMDGGLVEEPDTEEELQRLR